MWWPVEGSGERAHTHNGFHIIESLLANTESKGRLKLTYHGFLINDEDADFTKPLLKLMQLPACQRPEWCIPYVIDGQVEQTMEGRSTNKKSGGA